MNKIKLIILYIFIFSFTFILNFDYNSVYNFNFVSLTSITFESLIPAKLFAADNFAAANAYNEKIKAYEQFLQAVNDNADEATIKKYSDVYKAALKKYNALISETGQNFESAETIYNTLKTPDEDNGAQKPEGADSPADINNTVLKNIIESVRSYKIKNNPDAIISQLQNLIESNSLSAASSEITLAKIELADIYSKYKNDYRRAVDILKETAAGLNQEDEHYIKTITALKRAKYHLQGSEIITKINKTRAEAKNFLEAYKQTPLYKPITKTAALTKYYISLFKYRKSIAEYRSFKEKFDKSENFSYYAFISDVFGVGPAFGSVEDAFNNANLSIRDITAPVKHLTDNVEAFYARWRMLGNAKHSIDISYFIFDRDPIGNAILGMLLKKAREGVKIRLILDARGCGDFAKKIKSQDYLQELAAEKNAAVKIFNPIHKALPAIFSDVRNLISSNHQKIIIVDGGTLITGGRNISAHYLADPRDYKEAYRDTDVLIQSAELCEQLTMTFEEEFDALENYEVKKDLLGNWVKRDGELLDCAKSLDSWINGRGLYHSKKIEEINEEIASFKHMISYADYEHFKGAQIAPIKLFGKNGIMQERNDITENIIALINAASEEIIIQNPYVIFTDKAKAALKSAGERGVKIIINTNSPSCFPAANGDLMTLAFFLDEWIPFLKENPDARIYGVAIALKLHAKVFIFDRTVTVIGTYNMDPMSEDINAENVCAVNSKEFSEECRAKIFEDLSYSKEYKIGIDEKGEAYEIFGPGSLGDEKTLEKLKTIKKLKFLRPLI